MQYCTTKSEHRKALYFIPEHPKRRKEWLDACGIGPTKTIEICICWKHFRFEDFENEAGFGRLKKNVFPTQFPPTFVSSSHLDLGHVAVVDNNPDLPPLVPLEYTPISCLCGAVPIFFSFGREDFKNWELSCSVKLRYS